jgi:hypothetical protein
MKHCRICGRYGDSHIHVFKRLFKLFGLKPIFKIKRVKKKEAKQIEQQPIENLPLFTEEKHGRA